MLRFLLDTHIVIYVIKNKPGNKVRVRSFNFIY